MSENRENINLNQITKKIQGVHIDAKGIHNKRYLVKKIYQTLTNPDRPTDSASFHWRVDAVRYLEKMLRTEFRNTKGFKRKIEKYLENYEIRRRPVNERIKKARKKKKWTQKELATHLSYKTHVPIVQFEKGYRYPPEKVFQWLEEERM